MPRDGVIGEEIFTQVEELVKGGLNRTQAFAKISEDTGRQAGTVAANYYRVARKRAGGTLRKPKPASGDRKSKTSPKARKRRAPRTRSAPARGSEIDRLTAELVAAIQALGVAAREREADIHDLRSRLDGLRAALD